MSQIITFTLDYVMQLDKPVRAVCSSLTLSQQSAFSIIQLLSVLLISALSHFLFVLVKLEKAVRLISVGFSSKIYYHPIKSKKNQSKFHAYSVWVKCIIGALLNGVFGFKNILLCIHAGGTLSFLSHYWCLRLVYPPLSLFLSHNPFLFQCLLSGKQQNQTCLCKRAISIVCLITPLCQAASRK